MLRERDIAVKNIDSIFALTDLGKIFLKGYDAMVKKKKKQSQSSAVSNGRNVHNEPTFPQIIIFWTEYYTINVHTYITLKLTLILKNIKQHLKVVEANQKLVET